MDKQELDMLRAHALNVRRGIIMSTNAASSGHPGGSLSCTDILTWLYFKEMHIDPSNPTDPMRDRFVLSKGHAAPALYSVMAEKGFFPKEELLTLRKLGSRLQGHPSMRYLPGVDISTGSLGQGISAACGMALAGKMDNAPYRVYAVIGDGECQEGEVWEAAEFAAHYKLDNLCAVLDLNGLQIDGKVCDVMNIEPADAKFAAFGWNVTECDAHDFESISEAFRTAHECSGKPTMIIAHSVKGKGISFMENSVGWHGKATKPAEFEQAMKELDAAEVRNG